MPSPTKVHPAYKRAKHGKLGIPLHEPESRRFMANEQQLAFVKEWAAGNSVASAARRAGYATPDYCYELVRNPHVLALYEKEKQAFEAANDMSRQKVMAMLQESYDMAKLMSEPATMVAAAREVGKMCGYYAPVERKIKIEGNLVLDKMNRLSDAELLEMVQATERIDAVVEALEHEEDEHDAASPLAGPAAGPGNDAPEPQDPRDDDQDG